MPNQNDPGNIVIGHLNPSLFKDLDSVSRDSASGAVAGLIDHYRLALVNIFEWPNADFDDLVILAPFDLVILKFQMHVRTTGTAGNNDLNLSVDGSSVLAPVIRIPNTDADGTVKNSDDLEIAIAKDSRIELQRTRATGATDHANILMWIQRKGRAGGIGI